MPRREPKRQFCRVSGFGNCVANPSVLQWTIGYPLKDFLERKLLRQTSCERVGSTVQGL